MNTLISREKLVIPALGMTAVIATAVIRPLPMPAIEMVGCLCGIDCVTSHKHFLPFLLNYRVRAIVYYIPAV